MAKESARPPRPQWEVGKLYDVIGDHDRAGTKCRVEAVIQPTAAEDASTIKCVSDDGKCSFNAKEANLTLSRVQEPTAHTPPKVTGPV